MACPKSVVGHYAVAWTVLALLQLGAIPRARPDRACQICGDGGTGGLLPRHGGDTS